MIKFIILICYAVWLVLASLVSFMLYKKDKKMAMGNQGAVRIKEKTLLAISALGGALGSECGRRLCHHKTDKKYFSLVIYFSLLIQIAVAAILVVIALV